MSELRLYIDDDSKFRDVVLRLEKLLHDLQELRVFMSAELDALNASVSELKAVGPAVVTLLNGLSAQIAALKPDAAAIAQLAADVNAQADALAAAVLANTPV